MEEVVENSRSKATEARLLQYLCLACIDRLDPIIGDKLIDLISEYKICVPALFKGLTSPISF